MHDALFCYGTLQHPEVFKRITGMSPQYQSAQLDGYARFRVCRADYPGVVRQPGGVVDGLLCRGLTPRHWQYLDCFEGEFYQRALLTVRVNGSKQLAWVYVIRDYCHGLLTEEPWCLTDYQERFLRRLRARRL